MDGGEGKRADRYISLIPALISEELLRALIFYVMAHFFIVMIQLAESVLSDDSSLGIAYLLALDKVCLYII